MMSEKVTGSVRIRHIGQHVTGGVGDQTENCDLKGKYDTFRSEMFIFPVLPEIAFPYVGVMGTGQLDDKAFLGIPGNYIWPL